MIKAITMPRICLIALFVLGLAGSSQAQSNASQKEDSEKVKEEVRKVDEEWFQAVLKGDADTLDRIYIDDISFTYADGRMLTKAQAVDDVRTGRNKLFKLDHDDIRIHVYGDTAVLTGRTQSTLRCCDENAKTTQVHRRFTNIYKKLDGRWRLIAHQVTPIAGQ
jgi:uncharacterized protein (TIGR02246 family)